MLMQQQTIQTPKQKNNMSKRYRPNAGLVLFLRRPNAPSSVFVGRRFNPVPYPWQMPQGGIDDGEDPAQAALRELEEETGVAPHAVKIVGETREWLTYDFPDGVKARLFKNKYDGQTQKWFAIELDPEHGDQAININTPEPEFAEWQWVDFADTLDLIVPFKRPLYRQVYQELGALVG